MGKGGGISSPSISFCFMGKGGGISSPSIGLCFMGKGGGISSSSIGWPRMCVHDQVKVIKPMHTTYYSLKHISGPHMHCTFPVCHSPPPYIADVICTIYNQQICDVMTRTYINKACAIKPAYMHIKFSSRWD